MMSHFVPLIVSMNVSLIITMASQWVMPDSFFLMLMILDTTKSDLVMCVCLCFCVCLHACSCVCMCV